MLPSFVGDYATVEYEVKRGCLSMNENAIKLVNAMWKDVIEIKSAEVKKVLLESFEKTVQNSSDFTADDFRLMLLGEFYEYYMKY